MCSAQWPCRVQASQGVGIQGPRAYAPTSMSLTDAAVHCRLKLLGKGARGEHARLGSDQGGVDDAVRLHVQAVPKTVGQLPVLEAPLLLRQACARAPPCTQSRWLGSR